MRLLNGNYTTIINVGVRTARISERGYIQLLL